MTDIPVRFGPFTGANTRKARTTLGEGELEQAKGVVKEDAGRLRAIWEGSSAEVTFNALDSADEEPQRVEYFSTADKLVAFSNSGACTDAVDAKLVESKQTGGASQFVSAVEYRGRLHIFADGQPAISIHPDNISDTSTPSFSDSGIDNWYESGKPVVHGFDYYTTGTIATTTASATITGSGTSWLSANVFGQTVTSGEVWITPSLNDSGNFNVDDAEIQSYFLSVSGATTATIQGGVTAVRSLDATKYRMVTYGNVAKLRLPTVWKDRLVAADGRFYTTGTVMDGVNGGELDYQDASTLLAPAGVQGLDLQAGDILLLDDDGTPTTINADQSNYYDVTSGTTPVGNFDFGYTVVSISDGAGPGPDIGIEVAETVDSGISNAVWQKLRPITNRNTVYFAGSAADPDDWMDWNVLRSVIVGEPDADGDIVRLVPTEDVLYVFCKRSIWVISGTPPVETTFYPPDFRVRRIVGGTGLHAYDAVALDDTGQIVYFGSEGDGLFRLYGNTVEHIDLDVKGDASYPSDGNFSHLAFVDNRLWALTDESEPKTFILDTSRGGWTTSERVNSGQDQTGTLPALEISDGSYASNKLYESGQHGGIFTPYRSFDDQGNKLFGVYKDTDFKLRSIAAPGDEHNFANLCHGVKIVTGAVDGGITAPKIARQIRLIDTKPMQDDATASVTDASASVTNDSYDVTLSSAVSWSSGDVIKITDDNSTERDFIAANTGSSSTALQLTSAYPGATDATVTVNIYGQFQELRFETTSSEGPTVLSRDINSEFGDGDRRKYKCQGKRGRGDSSIQITVGDGVSPLPGELANIEADLRPLSHRNR